MIKTTYDDMQSFNASSPACPKGCGQDHELNLKFLINHHLNLGNLKLISLFEQPQLNVYTCSVMVTSVLTKPVFYVLIF